jgi:hypothetical protein
MISERGDALKALSSVPILALVLMGCTATRNLTVASSNNLELTYPPGQQHVTGEDCAYNVFGIPISGTSPPSIHQAIDNAKSMTPNMITNMTIHHDVLITLAYNQVCFRVVADALLQTTGNGYLDAVQRDFDWND